MQLATTDLTKAKVVVADNATSLSLSVDTPASTTTTTIYKAFLLARKNELQRVITPLQKELDNVNQLLLLFPVVVAADEASAAKVK